MKRAAFAVPLFALLLAGCSGDPEIEPWSRAFSPATPPEAGSPLSAGNRIAVGPSGEIAVWGYFSSGIQGDPTNSQVTLVRFSADGDLSFALGDVDPYARGAVFDPYGDMIVCGVFAGQVDTVAGLVSAEGVDSFVARYDVFGDVLWYRDFGADLGGPGVGGTSDALSVALDPLGGIVVVGHYEGNFGLGGDPLYTTQQDEHAAFVAQLDRMGNHVWSRSIHGNSQWAYRVVVDALRNVFVVGIEGAATPQGDHDVFVSTFDFTGEPRGTIHLHQGWFNLSDIAPRPGGGALITGAFEGPLGVGGTTLEAPGDSAGFLAALSPDGEVEWAQRIDGVSLADVGIVVDPRGHAFLAGGYHGTPDFGGGALPSAVEGTFVLELDDRGNHVWSRGFAEREIRSGASAIALAPGGDLVITGAFEGSLDLGSGKLEAHEEGGAEFVARLRR